MTLTFLHPSKGKRPGTAVTNGSERFAGEGSNTEILGYNQIQVGKSILIHTLRKCLVSVRSLKG